MSTIISEDSKIKVKKALVRAIEKLEIAERNYFRQNGDRHSAEELDTALEQVRTAYFNDMLGREAIPQD